jgi:hypothetical protein
MLHAGIFLEMRESDCFLPLSRLPTATAVWFRCGVHFTSALPVDRHVLKLDVCLRSLIACGSTETKHMFLWHPRWHPKQSEHWQSRIAWCMLRSLWCCHPNDQAGPQACRGKLFASTSACEQGDHCEHYFLVMQDALHAPDFRFASQQTCPL